MRMASMSHFAYSARERYFRNIENGLLTRINH